jgi:PAS domain S-box-containing protein
LAKDNAPTNPIARFFRADPYRELFYTLADNLDSSVLVLSGTEPRVVTCNHHFLLLTGYARKDLESLSPTDIFVGEIGQAALDKILGSWDESECSLQEVPFQTRSGEIVVVDLEAHPIVPGRSAILVTATPSSRRASELARQEVDSERLERLLQISDLILSGGEAALPAVLDLGRKLMQASSVGLYRLSSSSPDYVLHGVLPAEFPEFLPSAALGSLPDTTSWVLGQRPEFELQKSARAAELAQMRTTLIGDKEAWIGLLVAGWKNATELPQEVSLLLQVLANLCHAAIHVSLLRSSSVQDDHQISQLETEITGQFEAIGDTLIVVDERLKVLRANSGLTRLLGFHPSEVKDRPIQDVLVGPEDVTASLLDALGHHRDAERSRLILHHRDGTPLPVHMHAVPVSTARGSQLVIALKDQSEQQAIEDQTEILAQRALLGEVTAIFAHEVRNPINNISTGVQLAASRLGKDHPQYESLERVRAECIRLDQLMTDVLFFARPLELKMEALDLVDLMQRVLARWAPRFSQSNVRCHTDFKPSLPPASADPRTLERVIVNLISNALEAMTDGGTISIAITTTGHGPEGLLELKVADTGPGIPADKIDRIFDPFFTTKKDGTGLGLAISRRILSAHKGTIHVESFPDAGTLFTIHLPTATRAPGQE